MSNYNFDFSVIDRELGSAVREYTERYSETEGIDVILGDGQTPVTVVIPENKRSNPFVTVYCFDENAETKGVYQVVNPGGIIPHQNINAGLGVHIAKPPGIDIWYITRLSKKGLAQMGGVAPTEVRTQQAWQITVDRFADIRLEANGTLEPDFIGGDILVNGVDVKSVPSGTGPDFTSHVPGTTNEERWVLVGVDPDNGNFEVVDGTDLPIGTSTYEADAPKTMTAGYRAFAAVKLTNGDTEVQDNNIFPRAAIVTFNESGGGAMTSFTLAGDSGSSQTIADGNTATIAGGTGIDTVASATDTLTINIDSTVATLTGSQTLTNKTLTTPTIASFANATHDHTNAAGGGTLSASAIASGTLDNARVNWASPGTLGSSTPNTASVTTLNTSGEVVFNDAGADVDLRAEGDTDTHLLFLDAGADAVAMGISTPLTNAKLTVFKAFAADASNSAVWAGGNITVAATNALTAATFSASANHASGTVAEVRGVFMQAQSNSTQTVTTLKGAEFRAGSIAAGTVGTAIGFQVILFKTAGTITNAIGIQLSNVDQGGTTNSALVTNNGNVTINNGGDANTDFTVKGDTDASLLFVDASADQVNIGSTLKHTGSSVGLYNVTPVARASAYTQTYSTTTRTNNPASTAAFTGIASGVGGTPYAQLTSLNQLRTDHLSLAQLVNSLIDDLQAIGIVQ